MPRCEPLDGTERCNHSLLFAVELEQSALAPRKVFVPDAEVRVWRALRFLLVVTREVVRRQQPTQGDGSDGDGPPLFHLGCARASQPNEVVRVVAAQQGNRFVRARQNASIPADLASVHCFDEAFDAGARGSFERSHFRVFVRWFPRTDLLFVRRAGRHGPFRSVPPRGASCRQQGPSQCRRHLPKACHGPPRRVRARERGALRATRTSPWLPHRFVGVGTPGLNRTTSGFRRRVEPRWKGRRGRLGARMRARSTGPG